jgi:ribose 5-phosphate isomerase B
MKVAFGTDEHTALTDAVRAELESRGHTVVAVDDGQWVEVGHAVGQAVAGGRADTGVLFCWTGTGASIAANKVAGVRAALCTDAATAAGARTWNDANVLVMGLRLTSPELAREMLDAWFATAADPAEAEVIATLEESGTTRTQTAARPDFSHRSSASNPAEGRQSAGGEDPRG